MKPLALMSELFAAFGRKQTLSLRRAAAAVFPFKSWHVELAPAAVVVHEADFAKYRALRPAHVVDAQDGPRQPHVSVGITPV